MGDTMELNKIKSYLLYGAFAFVLFSPFNGKAQKKLIHYWDMNNTLPAGGGAGVSISPLAAEYSTLGHAFLVYNNAVTTAASCGCSVRDSLVDNGSGGSLINDRHILGNDTGGTSGGNLYIRTRNPMNNMKFLWYMPTTAYQNLLLSYSSELSSAGKPSQNYSYSLDSGLTFMTANLPVTSYTPGIAWGLQILDLSTISGANNNPKFVFCISYSGSAAQATSGNDRYDNITLEGDSICPSYTLQPIDQSICQNSSGFFLTHVIGGRNNTYQWQVNTGSGFTNINNSGVYSGATTDSLVLTSVINGMNTFQYQCIVSSGTCGNITTNTAVLTVNPTATITVNTATVCTGGSALLSANGGTTYTWTPVTGLSSSHTNTVTANPTITTTYTITGTNVGTCAGTTTTTLFVNSLPIISINGPTSVCKGQSTILTASGANTYTWITGPNTSTYTVSPTSYTTFSVIGTDVNLCMNSASASMLVKIPPTLSISNAATICSGDSATLAVNGAKTYIWSPASSLNTSVGAGVVAKPTTTTAYTVVGTATDGCEATATTTVNVNSLPVITVNTTTICAGAVATLTASGASTYTWNTGATTPIINSSPPTTSGYTVNGTDGNNCRSAQTATIKVNTLPTITVNTSTICAGTVTTLTARGASTYTWNTGATTPAINSSPALTTTYTVIGTDVNNCKNTTTTTIDVNTLPIISVNTPTICIGTAATLTANGALTYTWSTGAISSGIIVSPAINTTYTVTGTDGNNCTNANTTTVSIKTLPVIAIKTSTICLGASATLTVTGASTYTWSTNATTAVITPSPTLTTTYSVIGTDGNNCVNTGTTTVHVNALPIIAVNTPTICAGAATTLTANGVNTYTWSTGATTAIITSSPALTTTYTVSGTDGNNCTNTSIATVNVNSLPIISVNTPTICMGAIAALSAGGAATYTWNTGSNTVGISPSPTVSTTYTVSGEDVNNCVNTNTTTVIVNPLPIISINTPTLCVGATATLTASGANTYTWNTGVVAPEITPSPTLTTTYTVSGTDGNNCINMGTTTITVNSLPIINVNTSTICAGTTTTLTAVGADTYTWSTGGTTSGIALSPTVTTTYTVSGTDVNNCSNINVAAINVNSLPSFSVNPSAICVGSTATLTASGSTVVSYTWNTGETTSGITPSPTLTTTYTVSGTDNNNCSNISITTVTVNALPSIVANTSTICIGATTTLSASGANTYTWSPVTGLSGPVGASVIANPTVTTTYTITGSNGCVNTNTTSVFVNNLPLVTVNSSTICAGSQATLMANGANTYTWSTGETVATITPSPAITTTYAVKGADIKNCMNTGTATVIVNQLPAINILGAPFVCAGQSETLMATGATTYTWSGGGIDSTLLVSPTANITVYTVTGTDGHNCVSIATKTITISTKPVLTANSATICNGQSTLLNISGANTYVWSPATGLNGTTGSSVKANPTITTSYTITGNNGCINTTTISVTVDSLPQINITGLSVICAGQTTTLTALGQALTYTWTNGLITNSVAVSPATSITYTVVGTGGNSCKNAATQMVKVNPLPNVLINQGVSPISITNGSSVELTALGAVTYTWSTNATSASITESPLVSTSYCIIGMDNNKCLDTSCVNIIVEETCGNVFIPDAFSPNGDGVNELFKVYGKCISELTLQIFDRWGNKVFETTDQLIGWDGTFQGNKMNTGTYIYQAAYTLNTGEKDKTKGNIILIR